MTKDELLASIKDEEVTLENYLILVDIVSDYQQKSAKLITLVKNARVEGTVDKAFLLQIGLIMAGRV